MKTRKMGSRSGIFDPFTWPLQTGISLAIALCNRENRLQIPVPIAGSRSASARRTRGIQMATKLATIIVLSVLLGLAAAAVIAATVTSDGTVKSHQKISATAGGFRGRIVTFQQKKEQN